MHEDPAYEQSLQNWFHELRDHDPYDIRRDHVIAGWSDAQLRYFFSRP